jgi:maltooligosyltrehalose trehalohydrolase
VNLYAVQDSYGGPKGLQRFVDACHARGLAVWLDVVYNHLGPEGNYLPEFGPYFTDRHHTPWGSAVNLDGEGSAQVRRFFVDNAIMWARDFHIDGFRVDAIHALADDSDHPFLRQFATEIHDLANELGRTIHVVAENGLNDRQVLVDADAGGLGFDAAWNDEFHHAIHVAFTGERARYYAPFEKPVTDLATAFAQGYVMEGGPVPYRRGPNEGTTADLPRTSLIVFAQNHDQIGNRGQGDRLATLAPPAAIRLAAGLVLLSPWVPMLFMGEEWGETRPFLYFVDHGDPALREAVRTGRTQEFEGLITGDVRDPAARSTRDASVLDWSKLKDQGHRRMLQLHKELIVIRRRYPSITDPDRENHVVRQTGQVITLTNAGHGPATHIVFNVGSEGVSIPHAHAGWHRLIDGDDERFGGRGAHSPAILDEHPLQLAPWAFTAYREESR